MIDKCVAYEIQLIRQDAVIPHNKNLDKFNIPSLTEEYHLDVSQVVYRFLSADPIFVYPKYMLLCSIFDVH